jgi:hypothetical protein
VSDVAAVLKTMQRFVFCSLIWERRKCDSCVDGMQLAQDRANTRRNLGVSSLAKRLSALLDLLVVSKGKTTPLQAWTGPEGSRRLRLPDFKTVGT